jgi:hypothetical protein
MPVSVLTRDAQTWKAPILGTFGSLAVRGTDVIATSDPKSALDNVGIVLVASPAFAHERLLALIAPYLPSDAWVGALPAAGLFHERASAILRRRRRIFGTREAPCNCRIRLPGAEVEILGVARTLAVATAERDESDEAAALVETLFGIPATALSDPRAITLSPLNCAFHPSRLFSLFGEWRSGHSYARVPRFYEEWDQAAAEYYFRCSEELATLAIRLNVRVADIDPVPEHYGVCDAQQLAFRIRKLSGLRGIPSPMRQQGPRFVPDFSHRFFREDICVGLTLIMQLATANEVRTPTIERIVRWFGHISSTARSPAS